MAKTPFNPPSSTVHSQKLKDVYWTDQLTPNWDDNKISGTGFLNGDGYFEGGSYDPRNRCAFSYDSIQGDTKVLTLLIPPDQITWKYSLRTKVIDTYGGQVVQILGVQIDDFNLSGQIPTGAWGKSQASPSSEIIDNLEPYAYYPDSSGSKLKNSSYAVKNGLVHVANFFRDFFTEKTQYSYSVKNMLFQYPHYGWNIPIIPLQFPQVKIANTEIFPQWQLQCSVVEHLAGHWIGQLSRSHPINKKFEEDIEYGVGFTKFIKWSEMIGSPEDLLNESWVSDQAKNVGESYKNFFENFDPSDPDVLSNAGFSYPPDLLDNIKEATDSAIIDARLGVRTS
jgi:hypothetical protein